MKKITRSVFGLAAAFALTLSVGINGAAAGDKHKGAAPPQRVLIVLFDQMVPKYADIFHMPNFRRLRDSGRNFKEAYLGYMASETVIAHNVIVSGKHPKNMGWVDEAYRDVNNYFGKNVPGEPPAMHITGDLSLADFSTIVNAEGYPKLADYLHAAYPGTKFITVGEKSYAVESATTSAGDIGVRLSSRSSSSLHNECRDVILGGRYRFPAGKNVPTYLTEPFCGRWYINSDAGNSYGTTDAFPSWIYPEDGDRLFPGTSPAAKNGHAGGDVWVADAAIAMMAKENWSGMFVTLGGIDKAAHMWGAQYDAATFNGNCYVGTDAEIGAAQTHVRCAAEIADVQLGRLLVQVRRIDAARGGETLVVLTADHGATWGENFYGKTTPGASDSNWYFAPFGVWDAGSGATAIDTVTYTNPSPALQPLIDLKQTDGVTGNLQFSYQSTAIEAWLIDRSVPKMKEAAAAMLTMPGVTAAYFRHGDGFRLYGTNAMTTSERKWWKKHGQEVVDKMAAPSGPDVIGLLHDKTSYGAYGDHGGAQESVQRVPMVFWSRSLARRGVHASHGPFQTADVMPTILKAMGIPLTAKVDGKARPLAP